MTTALQRVGLIFLVILAASGVWQAAAQVEAKKDRPKWEYNIGRDGAMARALGDEGWELVAVVGREQADDRLYFKRQK